MKHDEMIAIIYEAEREAAKASVSDVRVEFSVAFLDAWLRDESGEVLGNWQTVKRAALESLAAHFRLATAKPAPESTPVASHFTDTKPVASKKTPDAGDKAATESAQPEHPLMPYTNLDAAIRLLNEGAHLILGHTTNYTKFAADMKELARRLHREKTALESARGDVPKVVRTAPEKIYLQISDDGYYAYEEFPHGVDYVTWCAESTTTVEVPYVRADLAQPSASAKAEDTNVINEVIASLMYEANLLDHDSESQSYLREIADKLSSAIAADGEAG